MDLEKRPDHSQILNQQIRAKDDPRPRQVPWLERFLERIGFFNHKYNIMYEPYITLILHYRSLISYWLGICYALAYVRIYLNTSSAVNTVIERIAAFTAIPRHAVQTSCYFFTFSAFST
jgi:hypothetical protein